MKQLLFLLAALLLTGAVLPAGPADSPINREDAPLQVFTEFEAGFLSVLAHTIRIGEDGTEFDYRTQGGQDILFPFHRFSLGATLFDRHRVAMLYQPLRLVTTTRIPADESITIDGETFGSEDSEEIPLHLTYSFPFYRISYSYDLLADEHRVLGVGGALQIRNASIIFESADGSAATVSQNVGLVPALHLYSRYTYASGLSLGLEATGIYASSAIINGATYEFTGSLLDASVRMGYQLKGSREIYGSIRFVGGTSKGTSQRDDRNWSESVELFTENNLGLLTVSMGYTFR